MTEQEDPGVRNSGDLTDDGRAPVLGEDQAGSPPKVEDAGEAKAIDLPIEENDFNSQPG